MLDWLFSYDGLKFVITIDVILLVPFLVIELIKFQLYMESRTKKKQKEEKK